MAKPIEEQIEALVEEFAQGAGASGAVNQVWRRDVQNFARNRVRRAVALGMERAADLTNNWGECECGAVDTLNALAIEIRAEAERILGGK